MNILIPDSWLRQYLKTDATPKDLQRCLSLCGPSIERTNIVGKDVVYDVEITTNRVDAYSVYGIAREAAAILPEFGFKTKLLPYTITEIPKKLPELDIAIEDPAAFCRRILAVKLTNINLGPSPKWMVERLEKAGQRPVNNIVDITNYVMWEYGIPAHAFDYDRLTEKKIIVREAKKGESLTTLDKKRHDTIGGELVFDDGTGKIIDLPSIMGTANTSVTPETKNVLLFIEISDPSHIRFASMAHGIRTQAATIIEKSPSPYEAHTSIIRAANLAVEIAGATYGSSLFDYFPAKTKPVPVCLRQEQLITYLGADIAPKRTLTILRNLGFNAGYKHHEYTITPPPWRPYDIAIPQDVVEEIARIYGYFNIPSRLPEGEPPVAQPRPELEWEQEIKIRLRDWGYTELMTYSMISEEQMDIFGYNKTRAYKITNPLSQDWVYMRPHAIASTLPVFIRNLSIQPHLKAFELTMSYDFRPGNLPHEKSVLNVLWAGDMFLEAKGLAEAICALMGVEFKPVAGDKTKTNNRFTAKMLQIGGYATIGVLSPELLSKLGTTTPVTRLYMDVEALVRDAHPVKVYHPVPKTPPVVEDLAFAVPGGFLVGPFMAYVKQIDPLITDVTLMDVHENFRTIHVIYQHTDQNLTTEDIAPIRQKILRLAEKEFGAKLKT